MQRLLLLRMVLQLLLLLLLHIYVAAASAAAASAAAVCAAAACFIAAGPFSRVIEFGWRELFFKCRVAVLSSCAAIEGFLPQLL